MLPLVIALLATAAIGVGSAYVGIRIIRVVREQFDELLPQRMIDYSGFVCVDKSGD
jgi:hypothetical protein